MYCFYIFQITALVQQHPGDLEAVEKEAAEEGHSQVAASSSVRKPKSKSEEEADFQEALLKSLEESRGTIAGMMKQAPAEDGDYLTLWGKTVVASMRQMSKNAWYRTVHWNRTDINNVAENSCKPWAIVSKS